MKLEGAEEKDGSHGGRHQIGDGFGEEGGLRAEEKRQGQKAGEEDALAEEGTEEGPADLGVGGLLPGVHVLEGPQGAHQDHQDEGVEGRVAQREFFQE